MPDGRSLRHTASVTVTHENKRFVPRKRIGRRNGVICQSIEARARRVRADSRTSTEAGQIDRGDVGNEGEPGDK